MRHDFATVFATLLTLQLGCSYEVRSDAQTEALDAPTERAADAPQAFQEAGQCPHEPGQTCAITPRASGCGDMLSFTISAGSCFAIAYGIWGRIQDDIACFDLTDDNTCTRTCAGYFELKNTTSNPVTIAAFSKPTETLGTVLPGIMSPADEQCSRMLNGPQAGDEYQNTDPWMTGPSGSQVRYKGGPTCESVPPAAGCL
jgi:hypothetical protein